ncbi:hypothetical protein HK100_002059 [Physocladia obscura]|uniref:Peptidase M14 domain-containing protein n=1 Tax=Physocladia obscura TaxID=109957 RepID=A0AAD5SYG0_9FUNG|nr:hypothetical protein HK100_002059 [Physocladia obscura]
MVLALKFVRFFVTIAAAFAAQLQPAIQGDLDGIPTYSQTVAQLEALAKQQQQHAAFREIGRTRTGLAIPALIIDARKQPLPTPLSNGGVVVVAQIQPREGLSLGLALKLAARLVAVPPNVRVVIVPIVNPDGFEELRLNFSQLGEDVVKNASPTCDSTSSANFSTNGVNLGHNWDFEWDYPIVSTEDFTDPCGPSYRGPDPFSEPETRALRDLILAESPKSVLIIHSRHTSDESRLLVPFMFHKSTFLSSAKYKMLSDSDSVVYQKLTRAMLDAPAQNAPTTATYTVGTSWETIGKTISGSDLDWIFDNTGAFSLIMQMGTADGLYWPSNELVDFLIDKHIDPLLALINLAPTLPLKTTAKTTNSSLLKKFSMLPVYLGIVLFLLVGAILSVSYCLGYDNVFSRFKSWVKRLERKLNNQRKRYIGLRSNHGSGGGDAGSSSVSSRRENSVDIEEELGLEDLIEVDEDDEGAGFSYQA